MCWFNILNLTAILDPGSGFWIRIQKTPVWIRIRNTEWNKHGSKNSKKANQIRTSDPIRESDCFFFCSVFVYTTLTSNSFWTGLWPDRYCRCPYTVWQLQPCPPFPLVLKRRWPGSHQQSGRHNTAHRSLLSNNAVDQVLISSLAGITLPTVPSCLITPLARSPSAVRPAKPCPPFPLV